MSYEIGKLLLFLGIVLAVIGLILMFLPGLRLGRLPGDLVVRRENWSLYVPIVTSILLSVVLTLILWLITWMRR